MLKNVISVLLSVFIMFTGFDGCAPHNDIAAEDTQTVSTSHKTRDKDLSDPLCTQERTDINYGDIRFEIYDSSEFNEKCSYIIKNCGNIFKAEQICEAYEYIYNELEKVYTYYELAYTEYAKDVSSAEWERIFDITSDTYHDMSENFNTAVTEMFASANREKYTEFTGEDVAAVFDSISDTDIELITELEKREDDLEAEYLELTVQDYTVEYSGEEWTFERLTGKEGITHPDYYEIADLLYEEYNSKVAPIYIELVDIRNRIAKANNYDSYAEYCYESVYSRGYTPDDIDVLKKLVKKHVCYEFEFLYYNTFPNGFDTVEIISDDIIPTMEKYLPYISQDMAEVLKYMTDHDMYFFADGENCSDEAYTTYLGSYSQPFIYCAVDGTSYDMSTMIHEFGHYANYFINAPASNIFFTDDYDICEVHSMGLEMLFSEYYGEIYGKDADMMYAKLLTDALETLITGCMYDEAQRRIYEYEGELDTDTVNGIFRETAEDYNYTYGYDKGYSWVDIQHNLTSPFYYISYAAAQAAALEIWTEGKLYGHQKAIDMYLEFCSYNPQTYYFPEVLELCGMTFMSSEQKFKDMTFAASNKITDLYYGIVDGAEEAA